MWRKVWEIVNQGAKNQNLTRADLSDANLSGADLSRANVENARFGYNSGVSESLKHDLIARGAIFEDSPPDARSGVLTPV